MRSDAARGQLCEIAPAHNIMLMKSEVLCLNVITVQIQCYYLAAQQSSAKTARSCCFVICSEILFFFKLCLTAILKWVRLNSFACGLIYFRRIYIERVLRLENAGLIALVCLTQGEGYF